MNNIIFEAGTGVGKAHVTITSTAGGSKEIFKDVCAVSLQGQTLVIYKRTKDGSTYTATYPESSVMLDIVAEKLGTKCDPNLKGRIPWL